MQGQRKKGLDRIGMVQHREGTGDGRLKGRTFSGEKMEHSMGGGMYPPQGKSPQHLALLGMIW